MFIFKLNFISTTALTVLRDTQKVNKEESNKELVFGSYLIVNNSSSASAPMTPPPQTAWSDVLVRTKST
jgi:hypothetical protein